MRTLLDLAVTPLAVVVLAATGAGCTSSDGAATSGSPLVDSAVATTVPPTTGPATTGAPSTVPPTTTPTSVPATAPAPPPASAPRTTAAPAPPPTAAPPRISSVRYVGTYPGVACPKGTQLDITIAWTAQGAAGVEIFSTTYGNLGQFPAEFGQAQVPYDCTGDPTTYTLTPVGEGGVYGSSVELPVAWFET